LSSLVTGAWSDNTFPVRKQLPNPCFQNLRTFSFFVFLTFSSNKFWWWLHVFSSWEDAHLRFASPSRRRVGCDFYFYTSKSKVDETIGHPNLPIFMFPYHTLVIIQHIYVCSPLGYLNSRNLTLVPILFLFHLFLQRILPWGTNFSSSTNLDRFTCNLYVPIHVLSNASSNFAMLTKLEKWTKPKGRTILLFFMKYRSP